MTRARSYLRLPLVYAAYLGGLRWSVNENVLERSDGSTFSFGPQIADFLEGFATRRAVLHFPFMVHLLSILGEDPEPNVDVQHVRLWEAFHASGKHWRNAGAFCAELCRSLPDAMSKEELKDVCQKLRSQSQIVHWSIFVPGASEEIAESILTESPPMEPEQFQAFLVDRLKSMTDEEIESWLEHGRGPVEEAAEAMSQAMPVTLSDRLDALLERPRLSAAQAYLKQLTGALTLPPRRLVQNDLPLGGYADVTTRGNVDQILPSQYALDDWDFLRRYAERELLYFRREEPHSQTREDLLVLLDQGVRTWGDVRIVLASALLAFGKQAIAKKTSFRLATTTSTEIVDPLEIDMDALARLVEASDLSPHPGTILEGVLEEPGPEARDIVLLTHPRSLQEPDLQTAAKRVRPGIRLFALTLDRLGHAALSEIRSGIPVPLREFHITMTAAPPVIESLPAEIARNDSGWLGDVEPIPFPFQFGINGVMQPRGFDFDPTGKYLLTAGPHGMLYLWHANGAIAEILPRGVVDGEVLRHVTRVICVMDGFVVAGLLPNDQRPVLMHYHMDQRRCTHHRIPGLKHTQWEIEYSWTYHCIVAESTGRQFVSVDLGTGEKYASNVGGPRTRASRAVEDREANKVPPQRLPIYFVDRQSKQYGLSIDRLTSVLSLHTSDHSWKTFIPQSDGKPRYRDHDFLDAQLRSDVLALLSRRPANDSASLCLYRGPGGRLLGEYSMSIHHAGFTLSQDGSLLARQVSKSIIEISHVAGTISPLGRTKVGGFVQKLDLWLDDYQLILAPGEYYLRLSWEMGVLECVRHTTTVSGKRATPEEIPEFLKQDRQRWYAGTSRRLTAVCDRYGQVALFDARDKLLCMFFAFRNHLAGWMPDGTRFGQASGHPRPEVMRKFGKALWLTSVKG